MSTLAPAIEVAGPLAGALAPAFLERLGAGVFEPWLRGRRWFGGKGRSARDVRLRDAIPLHPSDPASAVARLVVETGEGRAATYQVPLAVRGLAAAAGVAPLARLHAGDGDGVLFDATEDAAFLRWLGEAFRDGASFTGGDARWVVAALDGAGREAIPPGTEGVLGRAEQSNTSVRFGNEAILKLFRRLEPGENPDVEIGRFLATRTSFRNVPRLFGTIHFEDGGGARTVAGQLQAFVAGSRDAWSYALARLRAAAAGEGDAFDPDAYRLGELTRGLHEALGSDPSEPAFAPLPVTEADLRRWQAAVCAQADRSLDLLASSRGAGADVIARRASIPALVAALVGRAAPDPGSRVRHHGDYHLGQVLRGADGDFVVIDFEGEPARPLAERREKHSPLRDVAGMLRSFDYAAASVSRDDPALASGVVRAAASARQRFLAGYRAGEPSAILPRTGPAFDALLSLFEVEKVLYELAYELDNRPDWLPIPLGGLRAVFERAEHA